MKKQFLLIGLIAIAYLHANAQTPSSNADWSTKLFKINPVGVNTMEPQIRFRHHFKFQIANVNSIKLDGYTIAKPFNFETTAPLNFSDVKIPTVDSKSLEKAVENTEKKKADIAIEANGWRAKSRTKSGKSEAKKLSEKIEALQAKLDSINKVLIAYRISDFSNNYNKFAASYLALQKMACVEDTLYNMLPAVTVPDTQLIKTNARAYVVAIYTPHNGEDFLGAISNKQNELNESYLALKKAYQELNALIVESTAAMTGQFKTDEMTVEVDKATVTIKQKPKFENEFKTATKIFNNLNDGDNAAKLFYKAAKGVTLYKTIKESKFEIYTDAIQLNDDELEVTPSLKDKAGKLVKEFNPVTIKALGGIKVNFSTGYLLTFIGDDNYTQGSVGGKPGLIRQQKNDLTNSIGALAHIYPRTANGVSAGLSGGFSLTATGNIGFYLGGSGLFLEKNRLAFTAGVSFVKVNRLNTANLTVYNNDPASYNFNSDDIKTNYDSLYKPGFFVGITYNIFSGNETKSTK